jgi:rubredoxin
MKTIATFSKPEEAHLFRTRLEAAGFPAFVQDEYFVQNNWLWSNAIGGVRVQVGDEDGDAVREFLAADTPQHSADEVDVICPRCGSDKTAPDEFPRRMAFLSILLIRCPLPISRHRWHCAACDHVFRCPPAGNVPSP